MKYTEKKGITLIALVITIIVLIILAGVSINIFFANNSIINKAKNARNSYEKAYIDEKVQMIIAEYKIKNYTYGMELSTFLNEQKSKKNIDNWEEIDGSYNIELENYIAIIDKINLSIIDIYENEKMSRIILSKEIAEPNTNITATVKFGNKINYRDSKWIITTNETLGTNESDYTNSFMNETNIIDLSNLAENKYYLHVLVVDEDGNKEEKVKSFIIGYVIEKIILSKPEIILEVGNEEVIAFTIDPSNAKQEIEWTSEDNTIAKVDNNGRVLAISEGKTIITAKVQNSNDVKATCEVKVNKHELNINSYGEKVNYSANDVNDWKIFHIDDDLKQVYIITSDYLPVNKIPTGLETIATSGTYQVYWNSQPTYNIITDEVRNKFKFSWNKNTTGYNIKCISKLLDTQIWKSYATIKGSYAIGSPTIELWINSWNNIYKNDTIIYNPDFDSGYKIDNVDVKDISSKSGYNNDLYFPRKSIIENCKGYWISSPAYYTGNNNCMFNITYDGWIYSNDMNYKNKVYYSLRPVVSIPSELLKYDGENKIWNINE